MGSEFFLSRFILVERLPDDIDSFEQSNPGLALFSENGLIGQTPPSAKFLFSLINILYK